MLPLFSFSTADVVSSLLIVNKLASPTEVEITSMNLMGLVDILKSL